ncbi:MAG: hypothetical protein IPO08_06225 [Xanthomonadales bacterium]|nr:hypothetical protein [Xanthomonadales bacterium]
MRIQLSAEQEQRILELVGADVAAHLDGDCEPPGWGLRVSFYAAVGNWVEVEVGNVVVDLGPAQVDFGQVKDQERPITGTTNSSAQDRAPNDVGHANDSAHLERIEGVLSALRSAWAGRPDWRLGQLLWNVIPPTAQVPELFQLEDAELLAHLDKFVVAHPDSHASTTVTRLDSYSDNREAAA